MPDASDCAVDPRRDSHLRVATEIDDVPYPNRLNMPRRTWDDDRNEGIVQDEVRSQTENLMFQVRAMMGAVPLPGPHTVPPGGPPVYRDVLFWDLNTNVDFDELSSLPSDIPRAHIGCVQFMPLVEEAPLTLRDRAEECLEMVLRGFTVIADILRSVMTAIHAWAWLLAAMCFMPAL